MRFGGCLLLQHNLVPSHPKGDLQTGCCTSPGSLYRCQPRPHLQMVCLFTCPPLPFFCSSCPDSLTLQPGDLRGSTEAFAKVRAALCFELCSQWSPASENHGEGAQQQDTRVPLHTQACTCMPSRTHMLSFLSTADSGST